jgi:hypothetical protein
MQAIRQILDVKDHSFTVILPNDFNSNKVEVIILPFLKKNTKDNDDWSTTTKDAFLAGYSEEDSIYDSINYSNIH